jgi:CMP/dCMP kinase
MAVVTISREFGSGGDEVAGRLCEVLGYHSFSKDQIIQVAEESTLGKRNAIDYSEDTHEVQTFFNRLFHSTATPVQRIAWAENPSIATRPERADVVDTAVLSLIKRAILAGAKKGNMVIIGRGGQVLLKDTPGVLHVRIEAPIEKRIEWVKQQLKKDPAASSSEDKLLRAASEIVAIRDEASADFIRHYYNYDWNDPCLYHLVLNLGRLSIEQGVEIIETAVHGM